MEGSAYQFRVAVQVFQACSQALGEQLNRRTEQTIHGNSLQACKQTAYCACSIFDAVYQIFAEEQRQFEKAAESAMRHLVCFRRKVDNSPACSSRRSNHSLKSCLDRLQKAADLRSAEPALDQIHESRIREALIIITTQILPLGLLLQPLFSVIGIDRHLRHIDLNVANSL